jgi:two-component system, OmpR family, sensor histidine kinase KdpD
MSRHRTDSAPARNPSRGLETSRNLVTQLGGRYREIVADDRARALVDFARAEHATQLVIGSHPDHGWRDRIFGSFARQVIALSGTLDVHVISIAPTQDPVDSVSGVTGRSVRRTAKPLGRQRVMSAWGMFAVGLPVLVAILVPFRDRLAVATSLLIFLAFVLAVAAVGGRRISIIAALTAAVAENWYFVEPVGTLTIGSNQNLVALIVFVLVAVTVGTLVERTAKRSNEVGRARAEAEALARSSVTLAGETDPVPGLLDQIRTVFGFDGTAVLSQTNAGWSVVAGSGATVPHRPEDGEAFQLASAEAGQNLMLVVNGRRLGTDDRRILNVLATQLAVGLESRRLSGEAETAHVLGQVDSVRTALLRAVSHDLRSPLAAIKTYVTGLLATDVTWTADQVHDTLCEIDGETDRLNRVVGNLLDASRLEAGITAVSLCATAVQEVVWSAVDNFGSAVEVHIADATPPALADPALLERTIANVVANAVRFQPPGSPVIIDAAKILNEIQVRVVDRGPGIPDDQRVDVMKPFQRLGDRPLGEGVGLGLAIASGFVEAMHGTFSFEDTPGGGLTVVISLPAFPDPCGPEPTGPTP